MIHDNKGEELKPGDRVHVECIVNRVEQENSDGYGEVTLETLHPRNPEDPQANISTLTLSSRQVIKVSNDHNPISNLTDEQLAEYNAMDPGHGAGAADQPNEGGSKKKSK